MHEHEAIVELRESGLENSEIVAELLRRGRPVTLRTVQRVVLASAALWRAHETRARGLPHTSRHGHYTGSALVLAHVSLSNHARGYRKVHSWLQHRMSLHRVTIKRELVQAALLELYPEAHALRADRIFNRITKDGVTASSGRPTSATSGSPT